jgi:phosphotransferase system enzyme I (PtsP)
VRRFSAPASAIGPFRRLVRSIDAAALGGWIASPEAKGGAMRRAFTRFLETSGAVLSLSSLSTLQAVEIFSWRACC